MRFAHGETVTQHPCTGFGTDELGEQAYATFGPNVTVLGVGVEPVAGTEIAQRVDDAVQVDARLYLPYSHPSTPHDEWTVRGLRYAQQGDAEQWRSPLTGWEAGCVVNLRRRTG